VKADDRRRENGSAVDVTSLPNPRLRMHVGSIVGHKVLPIAAIISLPKANIILTLLPAVSREPRAIRDPRCHIYITHSSFFTAPPSLLILPIAPIVWPKSRREVRRRNGDIVAAGGVGGGPAFAISPGRDLLL
jgi:hypothetical protein